MLVCSQAEVRALQHLTAFWLEPLLPAGPVIVSDKAGVAYKSLCLSNLIYKVSLCPEFYNVLYKTNEEKHRNFLYSDLRA